MISSAVRGLILVLQLSTLICVFRDVDVCCASSCFDPYIVETLVAGLCPKSSRSVSIYGSPAPAVASSESLISVQFYKSFSAHERGGPAPSSVKYVFPFFLWSCLVED